MIKNLIINKFFKHFINHRKKTNRAIVFRSRPFPNILQYMHETSLMRTSHNLENKTLSDKYWTVQPVCMKVQAQTIFQCCIQTYFHITALVWVPKNELKFLKTSPIFFNINQLNNCPFFLPNYFITKVFEKLVHNWS